MKTGRSSVVDGKVDACRSFCDQWSNKYYRGDIGRGGDFVGRWLKTPVWCACYKADLFADKFIAWVNFRSVDGVTIVVNKAIYSGL